MSTERSQILLSYNNTYLLQEIILIIFYFQVSTFWKIEKKFSTHVTSQTMSRFFKNILLGVITVFDGLKAES